MQFKSPPIHRTPLYRAKNAYCGMRRRALNACGNEPSYANVELRMTLDQWLGWAVPEYERFTAANPDASPNAARKGDLGHYEIGNIEIVSAAANRAALGAAKRLQPSGLKLCTRCEAVKPAADFSRKAAAADGLSYWCRSCKSAVHKRWRRMRARDGAVPGETLNLET